MEKTNKILLASGCSHTAGGGFDVIHLFQKEFPDVDISNFKIYASYQFDTNDINYLTHIKKYLWPDILANLMGYKKSFNFAQNGGCIDTALDSLYHFIFQWIKDKKNTNDLEVFLQIPHYNRIPVFVSKNWNHEIIFPVEINDTNPIKGLFYDNFHNDTLSFFKSINKLYLFQKFCDGYNIKLNLIPYDFIYKDKSQQIIELDNKKFEKIDINKNDRLNVCRTSLDNVNFYDYKSMLSEMNFIYDENNQSIIENNIFNNFNMKFSSKYPPEKDTHLTKEGHLEFAKLIFFNIKQKDEK